MKIIFNEAFESLKEQFTNKDVRKIENLAFEFRVNDPEGVFYAEVKNGKLSIEPYEYYDNDVVFEGTYEVFCKIISGQINPAKAFLTGKIKVHGDLGKAAMLEKVLK